MSVKIYLRLAALAVGNEWGKGQDQKIKSKH